MLNLLSYLTRSSLFHVATCPVSQWVKVMATTGMSFGMTVGLLQSVGIIGMMTVEWPGDLQGFLAFFQAGVHHGRNG